MAPELFGENYNELVDIYSFAIVLLLDLVDAGPPAPGRLVQAFSSTLYRFWSIAYGLRT